LPELLSVNKEAPARTRLRVTYLEQRVPVGPVALHFGSERVVVERLVAAAYLELYGRVGEPWRWDRRRLIPTADLQALLAGDRLRIYVLRDRDLQPIGFCEFDRTAFPDIELAYFGLVAEAQGRGLGSWLLRTALKGEWSTAPDRIWLHTDTWDHPAAEHVYLRAGFVVYDVRYELPESL